jgi:hypothetical protein
LTRIRVTVVSSEGGACPGCFSFLSMPNTAVGASTAGSAVPTKHIRQPCQNKEDCDPARPQYSGYIVTNMEARRVTARSPSSSSKFATLGKLEGGGSSRGWKKGRHAVLAPECNENRVRKRETQRLLPWLLWRNTASDFKKGVRSLCRGLSRPFVRCVRTLPLSGVTVALQNVDVTAASKE